ncbi:MAG TPA: hypothetical protein VJ044_01150 [Candidatus Hodarchaeales archaeon]|nr:hypothetical protein [Candidatus Hodarchaeales archaeon]
MPVGNKRKTVTRRNMWNKASFWLKSFEKIELGVVEMRTILLMLFEKRF